jgi:hypothetical protein
VDVVEKRGPRLLVLEISAVFVTYSRMDAIGITGHASTAQTDMGHLGCLIYAHENGCDGDDFEDEPLSWDMHASFADCVQPGVVNYLPPRMDAIIGRGAGLYDFARMDRDKFASIGFDA